VELRLAYKDLADHKIWELASFLVDALPSSDFKNAQGEVIIISQSEDAKLSSEGFPTDKNNSGPDQIQLIVDQT
jgi:hypothetical protein